MPATAKSGGFRSVFSVAALVTAILTAPPASGQSAVEKGRYLVTLGDCVVCHTAPVPAAAPFAGGYPLHARFGTVYSTNITPDRKTGIGTWTDDQFYRAMHEGIAPGGRHLYPAFPYPYFASLTRADTDAIFAYLKTVRPVRQPPRPNALVFPTNIRAFMSVWNALFSPQDRFRADPARGAEWNRGGDLVHGIGHCGGCHSPKNFLFSDYQGRLLQGASIDGWYAPDLTPRGLGQWSIADIETYLKHGHNRFGAVTGSMQDVIRLSTSQWSDADRHAVAIYLKSLPPPQSRPTKETPVDPHAMADGAIVFSQHCSVCHADTRDYPSLAHNGIVAARDPTTIIRVILQGSQSVATPHGPVGFSMPAFAVLSDREIADVATYIRNSGGTRAPSVGAPQVRALRDMLTQGN